MTFLYRAIPNSLTMISDALKSLEVTCSYLGLQIFLRISTTAPFAPLAPVPSWKLVRLNILW